MALSLKQYKKMKEEGRVRYDTDALRQFNDSGIDTLLGDVSQQQSGGAALWNREQLAEQSAKIPQMRQSAKYVRAYLNSLGDEGAQARQRLDAVEEGLAHSENYLNNRAQAMAEDWTQPKLRAFRSEGEEKQLQQTKWQDALASTKRMNEKYGGMSLEELQEESRKLGGSEDAAHTADWLDTRIGQMKQAQREQQYKGFSPTQMRLEAQREDLDADTRDWLNNRAEQVQQEQSARTLQKEYDSNSARMDEINGYIANIQKKQAQASTERDKQILAEKAAPLFAEYDQLNAQQTALKARIGKVSRSEQGKRLTEETKNLEDFEKYSQFVPGMEEMDYNLKFSRLDESNASDAYEMINRPYEGANHLNYLTADERGVFNYLYNKGRQADAMQYLDTISEEINRRMTEDQVEKISKFSGSGVGGAILGSLYSVFTNLGAGAGILEDLKKVVSGQPIDTNSPAHLPANLTTAARGTVARNIESRVGGMGKIPSFLYQGGMSAVDSAVSMAIAGAVAGSVSGLAGAFAEGAPAVAEGLSEEAAKKLTAATGSLIIGSQVATQTVVDAKSRELTDGQAVMLGVLTGIAEAVSEKYSIEVILKNPKTLSQGIGNAILAEGTEEVVSNWLGRLADAMVAADKSELRQQYRKYLDSGESREKAFALTLLGLAKEDAESFLIGGLSGLALNAVGGRLYEREYESDDWQDVPEGAGSDDWQDVPEGAGSDEVIKTAQQAEEQKKAERARPLRQAKSELTAAEGTQYTQAFGKSHPNGIGVRMHQKGAETKTALNIESSEREYGAKDNTVLLRTADGGLVDAAAVDIVGDPEYEALIRYAANLNTMGARNMVYNFDSYKESAGNKADAVQYAKAYETLYEQGKRGVRFDTLKNSGLYAQEMDVLRDIAVSAVNMGRKDGSIGAAAEGRVTRKLRMPGASNAIGSKVEVEDGTVSHFSDEQKEVLQLIAEKTGRRIVITDRMADNENGMYDRSSGTILINSNANNDYASAVALHEATHGIRAAAPEAFYELQSFVMDYFVKSGRDVDLMMEEIGAQWAGRVRDDGDIIEEMVCQAVMGLMSDGQAAQRALESEKNKSRFQKIAQTLRDIAQKIREFIKGIGFDSKHNRQAAAMMESREALLALADKFSQAAESAKQTLRAEQKTEQKTEPASPTAEQETAEESEEAEEAPENDFKYAVDDAYFDEWEENVWNEVWNERQKNLNSTDKDFIDPGKFDEYGLPIVDEIEENKKKVDIDRLISENPDDANFWLNWVVARAADNVLKTYSKIEVSQAAYEKMARKIMKEYSISLKENQGFDAQLALKIREQMLKAEKGEVSFETVLQDLTDIMRDAIERSSEVSDPYKDAREELVGLTQGKTLVITESAEGLIKDSYGSIQNYRRAMMGHMYVALESNRKKRFEFGGTTPSDIISMFEEAYPGLVPEGADDTTGYQWLDNMLHGELAPQVINPYEGVPMGLDGAAIDMAYHVLTEVVQLKSDAAEEQRKAQKRKIASLNKEKKAVRQELAGQKKSSREQMEALKEKNRESKQEIAQLKREAEESRAKMNALWKARKEKLLREQDALRERVREERNYIHEQVEHLQLEVNSLGSRLQRSGSMDKNEQARLEMQRKDLARLQKKLAALDKGLEKPMVAARRSFREQYLEQQKKRVYRDKLGREFVRMEKMLDGKTPRNQYIPESLKMPLLNLLKQFDLETVSAPGKSAPKVWGNPNYLADVGARVKALSDVYNKLESKRDLDKYGVDYDISSMAFNQSIARELETAGEWLSGRNIYSMSGDELQYIYEILRNLESTLRESASIIVDGKKRVLAEYAAKCVNEINGVGFNKGKSAVAKLRNAFVATSLDPVRYGRFLSGYHDDAVIAKLMRDLHAGDKKSKEIEQHCFTTLENVTSRLGNAFLRKLQREDVEKFDFRDLDTGKRVPVSAGVLLSIYLTSRQASGMRHMVNDRWNSYTVIPDIKMLSADNVMSDIMRSHEKAKNEYAHRVRLTSEDIEKIESYVEGSRKLNAIAGAINKIFSGYLAEEINKTSMHRSGMLLATVKNYYPIKVDENDPEKKFEPEFEQTFRDVRIKSRSFTKQREVSYTAIVMDDALDVFARHVQESAEWCGMIIPVENFKKVYNSGTDKQLARAAIEQKFGRDARHYIEKLMGDIQKPKDTIDNNLFNRLGGNYMAMVLLANPGTALKQFAAFPTAFKYFGAKNVSAAFFAGIKSGAALVEKYSPYTSYMWYREKGNGTYMSQLSRQLSVVHRGMDVVDIMGKMDRLVINSLLFAAEQHVKQTTDLEYDSEAFKKEVARQFENCVDESQPNSMITSKPQFVRNNLLRVLSLNAFKSQNMAMGAGVLDSFMEMAARIDDYRNSKNESTRKAKNEAVTKFAAHLSGTLTSAALLAVLNLVSKLALYHRFDDLTDEEGIPNTGKLFREWAWSMAESVFGAFAWGENLVSLVESTVGGAKYINSLEVMSLNTVNNIAKSATTGNYWQLMANILDAVGVPGSNFLRLGKSIGSYWMNMLAHFNGIGGVITNNRMEYAYTMFDTLIVNQMEEGDRHAAQWLQDVWMAELVNNKGKSEKQAQDYIKSKIQSALAAGNEDVEQAALAYRNKDFSTYTQLVEKVENLGFDIVDVKKATDKVIGNVKDDLKQRGITDFDEAAEDLTAQGFTGEAAKEIAAELQTKEEEPKEDVFSDSSDGKPVMFTLGDAFDALSAGDTAQYEKIRDYLAEKGKDADAVDKAMRSLSRTKKLIQQFLENDDTDVRQDVMKKLVNIYGSRQTATDKIKEYQDKQEKKNNK